MSLKRRAGRVILNSGAIVAGVVFDAYPYSLPGIILTIEAILITSFVLTSRNRKTPTRTNAPSAITKST